MEQASLLEEIDTCTIVVYKDVKPSDKELFSIVQEFNDEELVVPKFQRSDNIWDFNKKKGWIESIAEKDAIGVIVTYQVKGNPTVFLADGLQRIKTTKLFLENPASFGVIEKYGREVTKSEARAMCKGFLMTVQHRVYESHRRAMKAYQNLNKGSFMTLEEFFKGVLQVSDYSFLADEIQKIVHAVEKEWKTAKFKETRTLESKQKRDCYGLFLQYITRYKGRSFWHVGDERQMFDENIPAVEQLIIDTILQRNLYEEDIKKLLKEFDLHLWKIKRFIDTIIIENGQQGWAMAPAFTRHIMHLVMYCENNNIPNSTYREYIKQFLSMYNIGGKQRFKSQFYIPQENDELRVFTISMDSLNSIPEVEKYTKINISTKQARKRTDRRIGNHDSHIKPFSVFGNGETISENALDNMARGAKEIS